MRTGSVARAVVGRMSPGNRPAAVEALEGRQLLAGVGVESVGDTAGTVIQSPRVARQVSSANHLLGTYSGQLVVEGTGQQGRDVRRMVVKVTGQAADRSLAGQMILDDDAVIGGDTTAFDFTGLFAGRNLTLVFNGDTGAGGFTGRIFNRGQRLVGSVTIDGDDNVEGQVRLLKRSAPDLRGNGASVSNGFIIPPAGTTLGFTTSDGSLFGSTTIGGTDIIGAGDILAGGPTGVSTVFGSSQDRFGMDVGSIF